MTTTPSAVSTASATASGTAMAIKDTDAVVLDGGKEQKQKLKLKQKPPPILVSPTPTPEQLGDLATAMVQKSEVAVAMNNGIDININGNINSSKNNKKSSLSLARSTSVVRSNCNSNSSNSNSKCKKEVFTFATVGHHDEMYEETKTKTKAKTNTNTNGTVTVTGASSSSCNTNTNSHSNSNSSSSKAKKSATTRIITTAATAAVSSASPPGLFQSSPSSSCNSHPPLISRYCGCCGDILSTKAYGFDEKNRDRRLRFHPQDYNNGIGVDRERIREAAESVRQRLLNKGNKISSNNKSSFSKSTKASRKKKKAAAAAAANHRNNNHNNNNNNNSIHSDNYHHHEGLSPWPEESLHMDMTILEGLISLKNTHSDEVGCRCWNGQTTLKGSVTNHSLFGGTTKNSLLSQSQSQSHPHPQSTTTYNKGSKKAAKASKNGGSGKTKTATKGKKTTLTKGAGSSVSKTNPETVVSTKTVIVRCPKTGKKIKKTVRVVKKLIKKKRLLSSAQKSMAIGAAALGATATSKGAASHSNSTAPAAGVASLSTSTSLPGTSASHKKAAAIPSFSVLGSGNKENNHRGLKQHSDDNGASPNRNGGSSGSSTSSNSNSNSSKKRSRDASSNEDDEDCGSGCSDDGSDDGTGLSSSLKKRRRNDEKADPDLRDRLMNCQLENGPLFPSQQELMELTTIRKRNALQTFYKRFNELRQFIGVFGDANVPQQFPENHSLGIWVNKMRMERKKWDTGSERTSLTERKIELLESIDFIWAQNHKGEIGWERRFQEIRKFKRKHGHCNVPTKSAENRALGRWVSTQRTMYKNYMKGFVGKSLTREEQERRIFLLLKEGFLFSMIPNGQNPGGFGSEDPDGEGSDSIETGAVPSSGLVSQAEAAADGTVTIVTSTMTTETAMEPATEASTPIIGGNECESERPKTSITDGKEDAKNICDIIEPKNYDEVSNNDNSEEKKDDFDNENDAKAAVPLSPSSQTKGTIEKPEAAAFSPPASQLTSIAQVSFTTTPTTTPSVSTTASPDRSPEKAISSSEEPNCAHAANAETITKEAESMEIQMKGCGIPTTKNTMPVAPSLKAESATTSEDAQITVLTYSGTKPSIKQVVSIKEATTGTESHTLTEIVATSDGNTTQDTPIPEACPQKENTGNRLEYKGAINRAPPFPGATSATSPGSDPMEELLSKDETVPVTAPDPSITTEAITNEKNSSAATEPRLVTSDGLRIIVTMQDFEDDASDRSPSTSIDGLPMMAPSPSRRSVRARKPSARQLEAEKKPLRETIIGR